MAFNLKVTRQASLFGSGTNDADSDGVIDPGDIVVIRIRLENLGDITAGSVTVQDSMTGISDPVNVRITPIADNDAFSMTGNTPITLSLNTLLANDSDPDDSTPTFTVSIVPASLNHVTVTVDSVNGTFTITPETGYVGAASFEYVITDEQGLQSVSTGTVSVTITDLVWYVDSAYAGANGASDGSYLKPFTSLAPLNDDGTGTAGTFGPADSVKGDDDVDGTGNTIFVYNRGASYSGGITLENGQKLYGDGHEFTVNNIAIGASSQTFGPGINHSTYGVTLADGNTIRGLTLTGTVSSAEGIRDGGGTVGSLFIDKTTVQGHGKAVDIDQGGALNVTLTNLSSSNSISEGVHLQGVSGNFTANGGSITGANGVGFLIGASGGNTASSGGSVNVTYAGSISGSGTQSVEIQDRTGGAVTFSGSISDSSIADGSTGILIDTAGTGFVTFNGQVTLTAAGTGNGVSITNTTGTVIINAAGAGLDITTNSGTGFNWVNGGDLNIGGNGNSITTATGVIFNGSNSRIGADKIFFNSLSSTGSVNGTAISLNNISSPGTFNVTTANIAGTTGAASDGIKISGSSAGVTFGATTIGATGDEGIELSGANGAVSFSSVTMNGQTGNGVEIVNATNSVTIGGGAIGGTDDPAGDVVYISGGTGAVTINANLTKSTSGNIVEITGHSGDAITIGGNLNSTAASNGISIVSNTGGAINFTGATKTLASTANVASITMASNTGNTAVSFQNGGLDIDVTTGVGIFASGTAGASSLTISGSGNTLDKTGATNHLINIDGVTSNITLQHVNQSVSTSATAISLKNTGSAGQFVITGTGAANSGGTLNGSTGSDNSTTSGIGIYLENVSNVSLSNMNFAGNYQNYGIRGHTVNNFTLKNSFMNGNYGTYAGSTDEEGAIKFGTNANGANGLTGTALFEGNSIGTVTGAAASIGAYDTVAIWNNTAGTLNFTMKDGTNQAIIGKNAIAGNDGVILQGRGGANITATITGVEFKGSRGDMVQVSAQGNATVNATITNNTFHNAHEDITSGGGGITISGGENPSNYTLTYNVTGNSFRGAEGPAIFVSTVGSTGTINGVISGNTIGVDDASNPQASALQATTGSSTSHGIDIRNEKFSGSGNLNHAVRIDNNIITDVAGPGIYLRSNNQGGGVGRLEATINNNKIEEVGPSSFGGISVIAGGATATDEGKLGLSLTGNFVHLNNSSGSDGDNNAVVVDQISEVAASVIYVPGYVPGATGGRGEQVPPAPGGTASTQLSNYWKGAPFNNQFSNGDFPNALNPGDVVDATQVKNLTGGTFVLGVPLLAAPAENNGWEAELAEKMVANPPVDTTHEQAQPSGDTSESGGSGSPTNDSPPPIQGTPEPTAPAPAVDDGRLSQDELDLIVEAAIARWIDAGATPDQVAAMRAVDINVLDMAGAYLGRSEAGSIGIDEDGAGHGWFIDLTPRDDSEFTGSDGYLKAVAGGSADGRMDLLTVVMHELGHQIGLEDDYQPGESSELMYGYINRGERRLPEADEVAEAGGGAVTGVYALAPVTVGTIPAGKTVDVYFNATVDQLSAGYVTNPISTSTVSGTQNGGGFTVTDDETMFLDTLTLGNMVFLDANKNGVFDSGDSGIAGVKVTLYIDSAPSGTPNGAYDHGQDRPASFIDVNNNGLYDAGETIVSVATTDANGLYSFSGLAPGEYIVVVNSSNFVTGGVLLGKNSVGASSDPDNNEPNDSNGYPTDINGDLQWDLVVSEAITLKYNEEPTVGNGNDTNNTLDFGFFAPNQAPVLGALNGDSGTFTENGAAVKIDAGGNVTVTDGDSANFDGGELKIAWNSSTGDSIIFGSGTGIDGSNNVSVGATTIGVLTLGTGSFSIALNSNANAANVQTLIRALEFSSAGDNPTAGARTFTITLKDGDGNDGGAGNDTATVTTTVNVVATPDAPQGTSSAMAINEDQVVTLSEAMFGFSDVDGNAFAGVRFTSAPTGGTLYYGAPNFIATAIVPGNGTTYSAADIAAGYVTFVPTADLNGNGAASITFAVVDNGGSPNVDATPNVLTLNIAAVNDAPSITNLSVTRSFFENSVNAAPQLIDSDVIFADVEGNVAGGSVSVTGLLAEDRVGIQNEGPAAGQIGVSGSDVTYGGTVIGTFTGGVGNTLTVTLNGAATVAAVDALIQNLTYANVSHTPTATRTLSINVIDGAGAGVGAAPVAFTAITGAADPFPGVDAGAFIAPNFVDLDGDGDLDAVVGNVDGSLQAFRNNGAGTAFTQLMGAANPFAGLNVGAVAAPAFIDLDGDGDKDALVGNHGGTITAFTNNGPNAAFTAYTGTNPITADVGDSAYPTAFDFDGDGDLDAIVGSQNGLISTFRNDGPNVAFTRLTGAANPFNNINTSFDSRPAFVDLDGDGDRDLVVGTNDGKFRAFRNNGNGAEFTELTGASNPFTAANIDVGNVAGPAFVDLDGDGDLDLVAGNSDGFLFAFRNVTPVHVTVLAENDEPSGGDKTIALSEDGTHVFTAADFGFTDTDGHTLKEVVITTAATDGGLFYQFTTPMPPGPPMIILSPVAAGAVVTLADINAGRFVFKPSANENGTGYASFTFQVRDTGGTDNAGQDTDQTANTITFDVASINDRPTHTHPILPTANEDEPITFSTATSNPITVVDVDAGNADVVTTLQVAAGTLTVNAAAIPSLTSITGDGTGTVVLTGTVSEINAALNGLTYTPVANAHGNVSISITTNDGGATGTDPGATGGPNDEQGTSSVVVDFRSVNDAPAGADKTIVSSEDDAYTFAWADFGFSDAIDNNGPVGIIIDTLPLKGVLKLNGANVTAGQSISKLDIDSNLLTYTPAADEFGTGYADFKFKVQDDGTTANGGQDTAAAANVITFNITPDNFAPSFDLSNLGPIATLAYTENQPAAQIAPSAQVADSDSPDFDTGSLTVSFQTNGEATDKLGIAAIGPITSNATEVLYNGTVIGTYAIATGANGDTLTVTFDSDATPDAAEALIQAVTYHSASEDPSTLARTVNFMLKDGDGGTSNASATVNVTAANDSPDGTSATITASEDAFRLLAATDFGFTDPDSADSMSAVTITAINGSGQLYYDADGTAGSGVPVAVTTFPQTYTVAELTAGKVSYKAAANANGNGLATIDFQVVDSAGAGNSTDPVGNVLTVNVTAVNDQPLATQAGPINATEQTATAIFAGVTLTDADLQAKNGGLGDWKGASFGVNRNPASNAQDVFTLVAGANFTIDGILLKSGGLTFGQISANLNGLFVVTFTSTQTEATTALVNEVVQAIRYTNSSDTPPASVQLAYGPDDDAPNQGQGAGDPNFSVKLVTVNIAAVNDAPVNSLGGTIGTGEDAVDAWLSGMSVSDPDANPATDKIFVTFQVANGSLAILTNVPGGIVAGDITATATGQITVHATLNQINATLAASNGLTYTPNPDFNGDDTLTVTTNDGGANGSDPNLTGDGSSEEDVDTRTITVSASPDTAVARNDAVSTAENVIGTGSVFANNGSGADYDPDGGGVTVEEVNGTTALVGVEFTLPSGALLKLNADGSYTYNPNGKFNALTDNSSGAVNTSATDTFTYKLTDGSTATVTVTVNGVAGAGDVLTGNSGPNTITGTPQPDFFRLDQGGDDTVSGLASNDGFFFGSTLNDKDVVDGGGGNDQIGIQGNYAGGNAVTLTGVTNVEQLVLLHGANTFFGAPGNLLYSYDLTSVDSNVAAGALMIVDGSQLEVGENFTFNGSAETDGSFLFFGGRGVDTLTGGAKADGFIFKGSGKLAATDVIDGGAGNDQVGLRGDYSGGNALTLGAGTLVNIEALVLLSGTDTRYGKATVPLSYDITTNNGNVDAGKQMTIDAASLREGETLTFNGSAEMDGTFRIFGGRGQDLITGGAGDDIIRGGGSGDTLYGGAGNDRFVYRNTTDSNSVERDGIQDFALGDIIDLSQIDANTLLAGNQAFDFIGAAEFSNKAGELRFKNVSNGGPVWEIQADTDGDGKTDLEIFVIVADSDPITANDFFL